MSSITGHRNNRNARRTTHVIGTSNEKEVFIEDDHEKDKEENEDNDGEEEDDEFEFKEEVDDETTLIEQEEMELQLEGSEDRQGELELLQRESEIPIEQLRAMYAGMGDHSSDDDEEEEEEDKEEKHTVADEYGDLEELKLSLEANDSPEGSAAMVRADGHNDDIDHNMPLTGDDEMMIVVESADTVQNAIQRLEAADLAARSIRVERPFVLSKKLSLREYQHIGLNWLVSLHERRLNGILADEMGLGKTIQTIALLAYLAIHKGLWGPHLVIVPTSCIINWEVEFKRFCPMFKILTYFGSSKRRKFLRTGWSKLNSFHVCITSYQIVVQDSTAFRRKRWYYMILDEAHNIKNFKSKRWQTLLNFNTQRRLLLTGTPLQNNLMELWSLMHFLMPHIFKSRKEFSYWFNNPLNGMIEGNRGINNDLIGRLHSIMRPFLLRRLKKDVAKQLPGKFEHLVMCRLSKRQLHLYEEFMARSSTKASLSGGGNFLGMMNILMQLRKVCNHPDLFEPRPISSPFAPINISYRAPPLITRALHKSPLSCISSHVIEFWPYYDMDRLSRDELQSLAAPKASFIQIEDLSLVDDADTDLYASHHHYHHRGIQEYVRNLRATLREQVQARNEFNYSVMSSRCRKPSLSYDWRLGAAVAVQFFCKQVIESQDNYYYNNNYYQGNNNNNKSNRQARFITASWYELIKSIAVRAKEMQPIIEQFVFVIPKVMTCGVEFISADTSSINQRSKLMNASPHWRQASSLISRSLLPFYPAWIRQRIFFPDRKLIQFDSGKLQMLAVLLRDLKKGGHKCLIFTQMSKVRQLRLLLYRSM